MSKMIFGPFSEDEMKSISSILEMHNINFNVQMDTNTDERIQDANKGIHAHNMGANLHTDFLQMEIDTSKLDSLDPETQTKLNELRVFWKEAEFKEEDFYCENEAMGKEYVPQKDPLWTKITLIVIFTPFLIILLWQIFRSLAN